MLGFTCVTPIKTVHGVLEVHGALDHLRDPLVTTPTQEVIADKRTRREIQRDIRPKERALRQAQPRTSTPVGDSSANPVQYRE